MKTQWHHQKPLIYMHKAFFAAPSRPGKRKLSDDGNLQSSKKPRIECIKNTQGRLLNSTQLW
jgi:hypothetical protein